MDAKGVESWLESGTFGAEPSARLSRGDVVGCWRVEAYLGRGLSAEVYRVTNVRYGHEGALKLLVDGTRGLKERFMSEADALKFLSLPSLPRYMDGGEFEGSPYYVMEYLLPIPDPMPRRDVPWFMCRVAKAVQDLHDAGYIHRDLKPGNVLVRPDGEPVLIDLGLIKRRGTAVTDPIVRHGRGVSIIDGKPVGVGTLDYAAPEQLLKGEASVQSDVFALGKMLRAMYAGSPPSFAKGVIRTATRELPGDRYPSAAAFAAALRRGRFVRGAFAALAVVALVASCIALCHLGELREWAARRLNPPPRLVTVAKGPNEPAAAYFARLKGLAADGNPVAQCALAEAYLYGQGTWTNEVEAVRWYRMAAKAGNSDAQASLGLCLHRGRGCERDVAEAVKWYSLAAEQKNLAAMSDLAFCKMHGIGIDQDREGAFALALEAAKSGHAPAQTFVGECYLDGRGVEQNTAAGETWLYRAARLGNARAKMLLETR